jgi:hypothetical protein
MTRPSRKSSALRSRNTASPRIALDELPELMTVAEFMAAGRVGKTAAYGMVRNGSVPVIRLGRLIRIPRSVLR